MMPPDQDNEAGRRATWRRENIATIVWMALFLMPPMLVVNSSAVTRFAWYGFFVFFVVLVLATAWSTRPSRISQRGIEGFYGVTSRVTAGKYISYFAATVLVLGLSVAFANITSADGITAAIATAFSATARPIFPWIGNFRLARASWDIPPAESLKIEAMMALWFVAFAILAILTFIMRRRLAPEQRAQNARATLNRVVSPPHSTPGLVIRILFSLWCAYCGFTGHLNFGGFGSNPCIVDTRCYAGDDLLLISAAVMQAFCAIGFGAAVVMYGAQLGRKYFPTLATK
ncbi:hypothetical protein [Aestuariivirga sp.]|uniref:hypothetical protein n=1 Tax=Aestuariivirga sp. TaxID=2650926 RepID=UPI0039E57761